MFVFLSRSFERPVFLIKAPVGRPSRQFLNTGRRRCLSLCLLSCHSCCCDCCCVVFLSLRNSLFGALVGFAIVQLALSITCSWTVEDLLVSLMTSSLPGSYIWSLYILHVYDRFLITCSSNWFWCWDSQILDRRAYFPSALCILSEFWNCGDIQRGHQTANS